MKTFLRHFWEIVIAALALICGHLVAIGLHGEKLFHDFWHYPAYFQWIFLGAVFVIFFACLAYLTHFAIRRLRFRNLATSECTPKKAMIFFLSTSNPKLKSMKFPLTINSKGQQAVLQGLNLKEDIDILEKENVWWNWERLLRSLLPHKDSLDYILLICSKATGDNSGSKLDAPLATELLHSYFPKLHVEESDALDFEDFKALSKFVFRSIKKIKRDRFEDKDIIIDITGGLKPTSIIGAITTINLGIQFQYISTITNCCVSYDIVYTPPSKAE